MYTKGIQVSIPSSGSIQFLQSHCGEEYGREYNWSQSPQAGQFNSYYDLIQVISKQGLFSLNPLKRVNSILTLMSPLVGLQMAGHLSQSPQAGQFNSYVGCLRLLSFLIKSQSPQAGQFNSYYLEMGQRWGFLLQSQSPQAGQFNSYSQLRE